MTNRNTKWILSLLLCAVMALGLCLGTASADSGITYIKRSWNGTAVTQTEVTEEMAQVPADGSMTAGKYFLGSDVTVNGRILLTGDTELILGDGFTLTVEGLYIPAGSTLTIFAQSDGENAGRLVSDTSSGAAIGGYDGHDNGNIVIHGGVIEADGGSECAGIGGNSNRASGAISIYGGTVTAKGSKNGAAIGSGANGTHGGITIYSGEVTADNSGYENGAGIGGGNKSDGGTIKIFGGTVTTWSRDGAGIGGGEAGEAGDITISGGTVTVHASGEGNGARIGSGNNARNENKNGVITITGGEVLTYNLDGAGIGGGEDSNGGKITISGGKINASPMNGSVSNGAAIGGGNHAGEGGNITITGGEVWAYGDNTAIGGGRARREDLLEHPLNSGYGGNITISGGQVHADSQYGFGIGAGASTYHEKTIYSYKIQGHIGNVGVIRIKGDAVVETRGFLAGIGGDNGRLFIEDGSVSIGGNNGEGLGIMFLNTEAQVNISGGTVTSDTSHASSGISADYCAVHISGGTIDLNVPNAHGSYALGNSVREIEGSLTIEGDAHIRIRCDYAGLGGFHSESHPEHYIFNPGPVIEIISSRWLKDGALPVYFEGARITAGGSKETATVQKYTDRYSINVSRANYRLIEPCDHVGTTREDGYCWACGHQEFPVQYVWHDWNAAAGTLITETRDSDASIVTIPDMNNRDLPGGWYYLSRDTTIDGRMTFDGDTHLILGDGCTLDVKGMYIPAGSTLTVYGQAGGTGKIVSHPNGGAGIGGYEGHDSGNIVIHGGIIEATGHDNCAGIGGNDGRTTGDITIYDGTVTATGGSRGAGIGGGKNGDAANITIYGGTVTATGKDDAAGIGGGDADSGHGNTGSIFIGGGTVTASVSGAGSAIGGADYGTTDVTITGGKVQASASGSGHGIGGGSRLSSDGSTVTLDYTDATRDGISITASSFSGTVTLEDGFINDNGRYGAGTVSPTDIMKLAGSALRAWDGTVVTWEDLQGMINGAEPGSTIRLTQSFTALPADSALTVPFGKVLTIDLNGFTLDRGLADGSAVQDGFVLEVQTGASLTLLDSQGGGMITGGNNSGNTGGIRNYGMLTMGNISVSGNKATGSGGGIYNDTNAGLTINSGTVSGNVSENWHGGGIYNAGALNLKGGTVIGNTAPNGQGGGILQAGTMNISGAPAVSGNGASQGNDVFLRGSLTMTVTGRLTAGAALYVTSASGAAFITDGYSAYNTAHPDSFFFAEAGYSVMQRNGEAYIGVARAGVPYVSRAWSGGAVESSELVTDTRWMDWPEGTDIPGGKYVAQGEITVDGRVTLQGNTSIILCDGCELNVKGLYIPAGCTLTIYGQSDGTGTLVSNPSGGAGIGGYSGHDNGSIVIHGGTIRATGYSNCAGIGSNDGQKTGSITIYGGTVTATGGSYGAGIGGGRDSDADLIRIYGGIVTATGKNSSAGIGGGDPQGDTAYTEYIEIYGGTVTAAGDDKGAGIGGGEYSSATVKIYGGKVTATGGDQGGAGIGSGKDGGASHIDITGGEVEARTASSAAVGMGNCDSSKGTSIMTFGYTDATGDGIRITSPSYGGSVTVNQSFIDSSLSAAFVPGTYADPAAMAGRTLVKYATAPAVYRTLAGTDGTADCYPVAAAIRSWDAAWYALTQNVAFDGEIAVTGNVNLILGDGFTLTAQNIKVPAGSSLTIWSQTNGTGKLIAAAIGGNAGIGGADCDCGAVTINGGVIQASGGSDGGAGIGGAKQKKGGLITINRGTVTASSGESGAGIGGGYKGTGSGTIVITGGSVTATGNSSSLTKTGAGIGGGYDCPSVAITITGGTVTATTNGHSAAIGAGACSFSTDHEGGTVTISGGKVTARNLDDDDLTSVGTAIGGAWKGGLVVVDIYGGQVTATGGFMSIGSARRGKTCYTYLSYTDETKDTMSVKADRYGRTSDSTGHVVTLVKGFRAEGDDSLQFAAGGYGLQVTMLDGLTLVPNPPVEYTVTFDPDNGENVKTRTVISGETAVQPAEPTRDGYAFTGWYPVTDGIMGDTAFDFENTAITGDLTLKAGWNEVPAFGTPDFVIPPSVTVIEANAFEGVAAGIVEIPAGCTSIGDYAFKDCTSLTMIRIPADCALGTDVFDGCALVYVFGTAGSPAETYCQGYNNCVFVSEGQN